MKKTILILAAILALGLVYGQNLVYYWNFNANVPATDQNWAQPIAANVGTASLTYTFTEAYSFTGTTINGTDGEVNGGSFCPRGGLENVNNGAWFTLSASTVGYDSVVLSYPTRKTSTGFTTQEVKYTINGTDWLTKETVNISAYENNWVATQLVTVDFSGTPGVGNNPNFAIRIVLTGAASAVGNNRFDNIRIHGVAGNTVATPIFSPPGGSYTTPQTVTISCTTPNSSIFYTIDGTAPTPASTPYSMPLTIATATTVKAIATAPGMSNSIVATAVYAFPVTVANLSALRASPADGTTVYTVSGEVVLSFKQTFRNQKYVQDAGAGVLIDDQFGVITTVYNVGDGITGISGKISEYGGMLQFVPTANTPAASSTGNAITPVVATYDQLVNSFDTYESRVVQVLGVTFATPTGNFANGLVYPTSDPDTDYNIRTTFYDVDYINTPIPTSPKDITGIPNSRADGNFFTPRSLADFADPAGAVASPTFSHPSGIYMSGFTLTISCATPATTIYYTVDGSEPTMASTLYSNPVMVLQSVTIKARAYLNASEYSGVSTAIYSLPVTVDNLTMLRQAPLQGLYRIGPEVLLTFSQSNRHQKFVQDAGAGILIDDPNGVITTTYAIGDGITMLTGMLTEFGGMLELTPVQDPGPPSSTGNTIAPEGITLEEFNNNFEDYESRLVKISDVRFTSPTGNLVNGMAYPINDLDNEFTGNFRTSFYDVDYIGNPVYTNLLNITGIPNSRTEGNYITARDVDDFQLSEVFPPHFVGLYIDEYPNVLTLFATYLAYHFSVIPENLTGYRLYRNNVLIQEAAPGMEAEWTDTLTSPGTYVYHATAMFGATESAPSNTFTHIYTANDDPAAPPAATALLGNRPNPFKPSTEIGFALKEAAPVRIDIFNLKGQLVRGLLNATVSAGDHALVWDGLDNSGNQSGSGLYYYRMQSGSFTETRKMLMLK